MKILKKYILIFYLFSTVIGHINAQTADNTSIVFDQFFQNYFLVNPASRDSLDKLRVSIGNRTLTGLFEGVNRIYADGSLKVNHQSSERFSRIGVLLMNNRDGEFINRTRAYARYSWTTGLGPRSSLSAGLALGIVNYSAQASQAGGGSSSFSFDGNLGIWYLRKKLGIGLSYQQINPRVSRLVNPRIPLTPYYNLNFYYTAELSYSIDLTTHLYLKYNAFDSNYLNAEVAPIFLFNKKFETGDRVFHAA